MSERTKLLLIDDQDVVPECCVEVLNGYDVGTVRDGLIGPRLLEELQPNLAVLDLKMPSISGMEVFGKIQADHPRSCSSSSPDLPPSAQRSKRKRCCGGSLIITNRKAALPGEPGKLLGAGKRRIRHPAGRAQSRLQTTAGTGARPAGKKTQHWLGIRFRAGGAAGNCEGEPVAVHA